MRDNFFFKMARRASQMTVSTYDFDTSFIGGRRKSHISLQSDFATSDTWGALTSGRASRLSMGSRLSRFSSPTDSIRTYASSLFGRYKIDLLKIETDNPAPNTRVLITKKDLLFLEKCVYFFWFLKTTRTREKKRFSLQFSNRLVNQFFQDMSLETIF